MTEFFVQLREHAIKTIWIGIVEEEHFHLITLWMTQGARDELRPKSGSTDPNHEQVFECAPRATNFGRLHVCGESLDGIDGLLDFPTNLRGRRQLWIAQPIMANHPIFIGIGNV